MTKSSSENLNKNKHRKPRNHNPNIPTQKTTFSTKKSFTQTKTTSKLNPKILSVKNVSSRALIILKSTIMQSCNKKLSSEPIWPKSSSVVMSYWTKASLSNRHSRSKTIKSDTFLSKSAVMFLSIRAPSFRPWKLDLMSRLANNASLAQEWSLETAA